MLKMKLRRTENSNRLPFFEPIELLFKVTTKIFFDLDVDQKV